MSMDAELETWRRDWQAESAVPPDLRGRVERQSRWLKIAIAGDVLVTVVIGGAVTTLAVRAPQADMLALAAGTWFFIAAAWFFRITVSRGLWSPEAISTAAFVDLSIRRCRAQLKATVFGALLYVFQMAFCLGWVWRHSAGGGTLIEWLAASLTGRIVAVVTIAFFGSLAWYRLRKRRELAWLMSIEER